MAFQPIRDWAATSEEAVTGADFQRIEDNTEYLYERVFREFSGVFSDAVEIGTPILLATAPLIVNVGDSVFINHLAYRFEGVNCESLELYLHWKYYNIDPASPATVTSGNIEVGIDERPIVADESVSEYRFLPSATVATFQTIGLPEEDVVFGISMNNFLNTPIFLLKNTNVDNRLIAVDLEVYIRNQGNGGSEMTTDALPFSDIGKLGRWNMAIDVGDHDN